MPDDKRGGDSPTDRTSKFKRMVVGENSRQINFIMFGKRYDKYDEIQDQANADVWAPEFLKYLIKTYFWDELVSNKWWDRINEWVDYGLEPGADPELMEEFLKTLQQQTKAVTLKLNDSIMIQAFMNTIAAKDKDDDEAGHINELYKHFEPDYEE